MYKHKKIKLLKIKKTMAPKYIKIIAIIVLAMVFSNCKNHYESKLNKTIKKSTTPPNIVFIMSDDHAYQAISAYGHGLNLTPNIDRIASEGAIFNKGFVTNSICAPSRAVMLTGKHSHINGKVDNIQSFDWNQDNFAKSLQKVGVSNCYGR